MILDLHSLPFIHLLPQLYLIHSVSLGDSSYSIIRRLNSNSFLGIHS